MRPDGLRRLNGVLVWPAKLAIRAGASPARTNPLTAQASDSASSLAPLCTLTLTGLGGGEFDGGDTGASFLRPRGTALPLD